MTRQDHMFKAADGEFHFIDWGGAGPPAHFSHATGLCAGAYTPLAERLKPRLHMAYPIKIIDKNTREAAEFWFGRV